MNPTPSPRVYEHDALFNAAFAAARKLRSQTVTVRQHRAFTPLKVTPALLAQAIALPLVICGLLWWARPLLDELWRACMLFWADQLYFPFTLPPGLLPEGRGLISGQDAAIGGPALSAGILLATVLGYALSYRFRNAAFPLRYPLRIVCVIQAVSVLYFWFAPGPFPYDVAKHSQELLTMGFAVMMAAPLLLAIGYYILDERLWKKLGYTALNLLFFAVMVPHQVLLHALILQNGSVMFMPALYFCFGAVFDGLVFIALYSWAASNVRKDPTA